MSREFDFEAELNKLPKKSGVYIMHDKDDVIIYVGKAVILRNRVRSYFRQSTKKTVKIQQMVKHIAWFEYIVTDTEVEALVLENNLIKENQPKYNTMLKDDKTYPYAKVTLGEAFPRLLITRRVERDGAKYFGPYTLSEALKETVELLRKEYKIRTCSGKLDEEKGATCLYYHIGQCDGPCVGGISKEEYAEKIDEVIDFLNGNQKPMIARLKEKMQQASLNMEFEQAAQYRDLIGSIEQLSQKQKITDTGGENRDIIAMAREGQSVIIQMFFVREGKMVGKEHYYMKHAEDETDADIMSAFLVQFYMDAPMLPKEIIMQSEPANMEVISEWMCEHKGSKVNIVIPQKGKKEKLLLLAYENARIKLNQDLEKIKSNQARTVGAQMQLTQLLDLSDIHRMEAYDISNISGFDSVGSMVVYVDGKPKPNDYRKFKIKSVEGPNDYASMKEVLTRRFQHGLNEDKSSDRFSVFPDLILMDGGRGQVNIATQVLDELGLSIPVCGMVKDDNHRTRGLYYENVEIPIDRDSEAFKLITRIQDEAHRFAITFHRQLRSKSQVHSVLDDIKGVGPTRRRALMKSFESIEDIKKASIEDLSKVEGFNAAAARQVYDFFHQ